MIISPPSFDSPKWLAAFGVALIGHLSLAYVFANKSTSEIEPFAMTAVMLEFADFPQSATKIEPVTIGPPKEITQDSAASPSEPQPEVLNEAPKIVVEESLVEPKAEIVVEKQPKVKEKPKEKPRVEKEKSQKVVKKAPEKPAKKTKPNEEKVVKENASNINSQATSQINSAPPKGDDSKNAAPNDSSSEHRSLAQNWQAKVLGHLARYQQYPEFARSNNIEGTVLTAIKIDSKGNVLEVAIRKSSGASILDNEAMATAKRASPFPIPPAHLSERGTLTLPIPIRFNVKEFNKAKSR